MADHLLSPAEVAALLGQSEADVLDHAAREQLTWTTTASGEVLYHRGTAEALRARLDPPADDPLLSLAEAADLLGTGRATAARHVPRDPAGTRSRGYRRSAVLAAKQWRDAGVPDPLPPREAPLAASEVFAAQAAYRARGGAR